MSEAHIPVTASTFSITAMSVDRYFTVKNYSPIGQVASRRQLIIICVAATWLWAMVLSGFEIMAIYQQSWEKLVTIVRITLAHIVPGATVLMAHLGVYAKLTAMSLTARAKHGELPLPIPLIRRPTHVIIVAGMPQVQRFKGSNI
ncbi:hypothetical protein NQ315_010404 [Exocentrus adspersus]|uniref:G-protein coupled receptors family 1 profile domain-containing protein n=1 Tax=Exocentrus adspersus TaxID=1586481 RepID=A0AAV8WB48_9CUCU|nr:hypothetical protein NQ315_010404 [Exocentrus adspersus]